MSTLPDGTKRFGPAPNPNPIFKCEGECGRMTRPTNMKLADAPDTVARQSSKMCRTCTDKLSPPKHRTIDRTEVPTEAVQATLRSLDSWAIQRNRRLAQKRKARL